MKNRNDELCLNLRQVNEEIHAACSASGRNPSDVRLIAVGKTKPATDIRALMEAGHREFGENYVQEALEKIELLKGAHSNVRWHFIGALQSNKAKFIPGNFSLFHGLHSLSVAEKIDKKAGELGVVQDCLVEINVDAETSKAGILPKDLTEFLRSLTQMKSLRILGLMCIPDPAKDSRAAFKAMRKLLDEANAADAYPHALTELSMGMSLDFSAAIEEGATMVRVGSRIFGARDKK